MKEIYYTSPISHVIQQNLFASVVVKCIDMYCVCTCKDVLDMAWEGRCFRSLQMVRESITVHVFNVQEQNTLKCRHAKCLASCLADSRGWKLSQRSDHHTQTCPSNIWSPWKQPSSIPARGRYCDIMEDQTEPCLPGDGMLLKHPPSFLSFPVR